MDDRHADDVEDIDEAVEVAVERPGEPEVEQLVHRLPEDPETQQDPAVAVGSREHAEVDEEEEEVEEVVDDELYFGYLDEAQVAERPLLAQLALRQHLVEGAAHLQQDHCVVRQPVGVVPGPQEVAAPGTDT